MERLRFYKLLTKTIATLTYWSW